FDLFARVLADVGDVEQTRRCVEGVAPRIAQTLCPDLAALTGLTDEGIVTRNRIGITVIDIEAQQRAEQRIRILAVPIRIPTAASVTDAGVQHSIKAERQ